MKILRFAVISFFILFGLLVLPGTFTKAYGAGIPIYLGEFCWQEVDGGIVRLAITHMGNGHLLVNGRATRISGIVQAVNGSAEIVGTQVIIHATTSGFDAGNVWGVLGTIVLGPGLHGTMEALNLTHDRESPTGVITYHGPETLTFISCP